MVTNPRRLLRAAVSSQILTDTELEWLTYAVHASRKDQRGSGGRQPPGYLDINSISALDDLQRCLHPGFIRLVCVHGNVTGSPVRCRWCEGCRHNWRARVRAQILQGCFMQVSFMWTLTIREYPREGDVGYVFDQIQDRWHNLLRRAGKAEIHFEYLRVVELQKRGTPHFHFAFNRYRREGVSVLRTSEIRPALVELAKASGFGWRQGKTFDFDAARLGGPGVASYLSKYLTKSEDWYTMVRVDKNGKERSIRRYAKSRRWIPRRSDPVWRYAAVQGGFSSHEQFIPDLRCSCALGFMLPRDAQAKAWLRANRSAGSWVAPLGVADYIWEVEHGS